ncbi:MAG: hypothetical protein QW083_01620, partial [Methanomassiliicoccales archaeon]
MTSSVFTRKDWDRAVNLKAVAWECIPSRRPVPDHDEQGGAASPRLPPSVSPCASHRMTGSLLKDPPNLPTTEPPVVFGGPLSPRGVCCGETHPLCDLRCRRGAQASKLLTPLRHTAPVPHLVNNPDFMAWKGAQRPARAAPVDPSFCCTSTPTRPSCGLAEFVCFSQIPTVGEAEGSKNLSIDPPKGFT